MIAWCVVLFCLGVAAFLDSLFSYGEIFRRINSILFMLVSLGMLFRIALKMKTGRVEQYLEKIEWLEKKLEDMQPEKKESRAAKKPESTTA
jgi:hypothetical protein